MKSEKYIEWQDDFRQGVELIIPSPVMAVSPGDTVRWNAIYLSERFNIAPKLIDKGIHKANRLWRYYTFKQLPGAVIFLGAK